MTWPTSSVTAGSRSAGTGRSSTTCHTEKCCHTRASSPEAVEAIIADLRRELPGVTFAAERATGFALEDDYRSQHPVPDDAIYGPIGSPEGGAVGKLLGRHPELAEDEFLARVAEVVGDRGIVAFSGAGGLAEISAPGVTKAAALESWCTDLGIGAEEVWAFGDMPNDLPMILWAGTSFAVANAHPDVVAAADHVCPSNDEDGVAQILERLLEPSDHVRRLPTYRDSRRRDDDRRALWTA